MVGVGGGKAKLTLDNGQTYEFDCTNITVSTDVTGDHQLSINGKRSKTDALNTIYTAGSGVTTSIEMPASCEVIDVLRGGRIPANLRENFQKHPDGSESWIEVSTDLNGRRRMRTVYASEWSNYLAPVVHYTKCECCSCKPVDRTGLMQLDVHCPVHGEVGARPCTEHRTTGHPYSSNDNQVEIPRSVQDFRISGYI